MVNTANQVRDSAPWVGSIIFVAIWLIVGTTVAYYVKARTKDRSMADGNCKMAFWLVFMGCVCMWIMWICTFMHQLNPLIFATTTSAPF